MKNESWASSRSFQRGSAFLRIARASSMPTDLPPISPVPIIRFQMPSTSGRVKIPLPSRMTRSSREIAMRSNSGRSCIGLSAVRCPRLTPSQTSSACKKRAIPFAQPQADGFQAGPGPSGKDFGDGRTFRDRQKLVAVPMVQHVHRGRVALLHLGRMEIELPLVPVDIDEDLRGLGDRGRGVKAVAVAEQAESRPTTGDRRRRGK